MSDRCESDCPRLLYRFSRLSQSARVKPSSPDTKMVAIPSDSDQSISGHSSKRSSANTNANGASAKKVKDDAPSRILTVELIAEKFSRMDRNPEKPINEIYFTDQSYEMMWSFRASTSSKGQQESLALIATCKPDIDRSHKWYNIVDISIVLKPANGSSKPVTRRKVEVISSDMPSIEFENIEGMKILRDISKGYLTANDELIIQVYFEKHMFFKFTPLTCVSECFWQKEAASPPDGKCYWTITQLISQLLNCPKRSDVKIKTADAIIPAHKFVLANFSPILDREMYENGKNEIDLTSTSSKAVLVLLTFFYRHEFIFSEELLLEVYDTASKLGCIDISAFCLYMLTPDVVSRVLCDTPNVPPDSHTNDLIQRSHSILLSAIDVFAQKDLIKLLPRDQLEAVLQSDELKISEFMLYQHCEKWAQLECTRQGVEVSVENKQKVFGDLKYSFRFSEMSTTEFRDGPRAGDLLTQDDKIEVLLHIFSGDEKPCRFMSSKRKRAQ